MSDLTWEPGAETVVAEVNIHRIVIDASGCIVLERTAHGTRDTVTDVARLVEALRRAKSLSQESDGDAGQPTGDTDA